MRALGTLAATVAAGRSAVRKGMGDYPVHGSTGVIGYTAHPEYEGDAILAARVGANAGRLNVVSGKYGVTDNTIIVRLEGGCVLPFVWRQLDAKRLNSLVFGSGQPLITGAQLKALPLALPTLPEQRAIAAVLSDVDALLGGLNGLIAKKRDLSRAAIQQLLTGKTRLPGFNGQWEVKRLGDSVQFLRNGVHSRAELNGDGVLKYLHYGDIHTCRDVVLDPRVTAMPSLPVHRGRSLDRLQDGDLVFVDASEDLDGVGKSVEIAGMSGAQAVPGLHTIAARFNKTVLADGFKAYLQFLPAFRAHLTRLAAGTKVYATNRAHIASAELQLPGTREQAAIAAALADMNAEISALEARRDKTSALKQAMTQELLTGRTRLV